MPTTNSVFRPELGVLAYEYSLGAAQQGFIGRQVLPVFETDLRAAQYPMIPAEAILEMQDTARAPRSAYARGDYSFESAEYYCREYGWEEPLDDTEAMLYRRYFDAEVVAVQRATLMILRNEEKRVVEATINNAGLPNGAVAKAWSSYADAIRWPTSTRPRTISDFPSACSPMPWSWMWTSCATSACAMRSWIASNTAIPTPCAAS